MISKMDVVSYGYGTRTIEVFKILLSSFLQHISVSAKNKQITGSDLTCKSPNNFSVLGGNGNTLKKRRQQNKGINKHRSPVSQINTQQQPYSRPLLFFTVHYLDGSMVFCAYAMFKLCVSGIQKAIFPIFLISH
jgi:hypothetical protein